MNRPLPHGFAGAHPLTVRERLELEIDRLIDLLDEIDSDPDLEPGGDELDQSFPEGSTRPGDHRLEDDEISDNDRQINPVTLNPAHQLPAKHIRRAAR